MEESNKIGRRKVITGLGIGLATMAFSPTFATPVSDFGSAPPGDLEDPTKKYPRPPFKSQS
ncbi:MAG TPA: NAD(P)-dependent oxidoreductase, partial [Flavisolibacter sp.]|nr:NAD(P)-dependent oxidoreductase [Flavisolibacter sp.]